MKQTNKSNWKARFAKKNVTTDKDFIKSVKEFRRSTHPLIIEGKAGSGKLTQTRLAVVNTGLKVVTIRCSQKLTFSKLFGEKKDNKIYLGTLGSILSDNKDTYLILDEAENYPSDAEMVKALILFCKEKKIRFAGGTEFEKPALTIKTVIVTSDIEKLCFLLEPWLTIPSMN